MLKLIAIKLYDTFHIIVNFHIPSKRLDCDSFGRGDLGDTIQWVNENLVINAKARTRSFSQKCAHLISLWLTMSSRSSADYAVSIILV